MVDSTIRVPVARPEEVSLIGPIAATFGEALDRTIEILSIVSPEDDLRLEQDRFRGVVSDLEAQLGYPVGFRLVVSDDRASAFVELCKDRLTAMLTSASPFDQTHYVGSFASALLAVSEAPVILVGPAVAEGTSFEPQRVFVGRSCDVDDTAATHAAEIFARQLELRVATVTIDPKGIVYEHDYNDEHIDRPDEVHAKMRPGPIDKEEIADILVDQASAGLLVLTTRAHQQLARICGGSVAMDTIARATSPIVVLGPEATASFELVAR